MPKPENYVELIQLRRELLLGAVGYAGGDLKRTGLHSRTPGPE